MNANHSLWETENFDVTQYINSIKTQKNKNRLSLVVNTSSFEEICEKVRMYINNKHKEEEALHKDKTAQSKGKDKWIDLRHEMLIGKSDAIKLFKEEIEEYLRKNDLLQSKDYPSYYPSLTEAIYREVYWLGCVSLWWDHPKFATSQACRIVGTHVYFEIDGKNELQPFKYDSYEKVESIADILRRRSPNAQLNKEAPELEIDMEDGTRVTIFIRPRSYKPIIIFRNYTIRKVTLEDLCRFNTFPAESLPLLRGLAIGRANSLVVGKVKSGKTTFLKALYDARNASDDVCVVVEKDFHELRLSEHYPEHQVLEMIAKEEDLKELFPRLLRSDFDYCIVGEMRSVEAEIYLLSCERGSMGALSTFHTLSPANIPSQMARLICNEYSNRNYQSELERVGGNVDIVFVCEEMEDKTKKLTRISEILLDPKTLETKVNDIMKYDLDEKKWYYANELSEDLIYRMKKHNYKETENMLVQLKRLSEQKPIKK